MQSTKRAILYPVVGWTIWMTIIMTVYELVSEGVRNSEFFPVLATVLSAIAVVIFSVLYLRKVGQSTYREGALVGITATVVVIVLDLVHNVIMSVPLGDYLSRSSPILLSIPLITTLIFGTLRKK